jgi:excisionase family DNA binding protein
MTKRPEGYCLVSEYAAAHGVSPRYIYQLIGDGRLQAIRFRGRKYLRPEDPIPQSPVAVERERLASERLLARQHEGSVMPMPHSPWIASRIRRSRVSRRCVSCGTMIGAGEAYLCWAETRFLKRAICISCATVEPLRWPCRAIEDHIRKEESNA